VARRREDAAGHDVVVVVVVAVRAGKRDHRPDHKTDDCVHLDAFPVFGGGVAPSPCFP